MNLSLAKPKPNSATRSYKRNLVVLLVIVAALYWTQLFYQLQVEWSSNEQYSFCWFVPCIAAALLWQRSRDEVEPKPPRGGGWTAIGALALLLLAILPALRFIEEANSGWRKVHWVHGIVLVALSLQALWWLGGGGWLRHYCFPVLFLLLAIPWPYLLENLLVQRLMRVVAGLTVEVLSPLGVPAVQHGNLLEISSGVLSVEGACSGVRSIQTSLMIALLLGELFRLSLWRRVLLVPLALVIAFCANVGRTSFLTFVAAHHGLPTMESYHGMAGLAVVVLVLFVILASALALRRLEDVGQLSAAASNPALLGGTASRPHPGSLQTDKDIPSTEPAFEALHTQSPALGEAVLRMPCLVALLIWLGCSEATTAWWFHQGDKRAVSNPAWSIEWPTKAVDYREVQFREVEHEMLRFDAGKEATWQDQVGNRWSFIALRWAAANKYSFIARGHSPDICCAGGGWRLSGEPPPTHLFVKGLDFPVRRYIFDVEGKTTYVFLVLWDERSPRGRQDLPLPLTWGDHLKAAVEGKRQQGLKKLEVSVMGPTDPDNALKAFQDLLGKLVVLP